MPRNVKTASPATRSAGRSEPRHLMMLAGLLLSTDTDMAPLFAQDTPVQPAARYGSVRIVVNRLSRVASVALMAAALAEGPSGASFAADLPAQELTDWDISAWSVTSAAACAVVLTKAGYLGSEVTDSTADLDRLAQGLALDALSKSDDPAVNQAAWATPVVNLRNDAYTMMQLECADLFKAAQARGLIPHSVLTAARAKATAYMAANGLSP